MIKRTKYFLVLYSYLNLLLGINCYAIVFVGRMELVISPQCVTAVGVHTSLFVHNPYNVVVSFTTVNTLNLFYNIPFQPCS